MSGSVRMAIAVAVLAAAVIGVAAAVELRGEPAGMEASAVAGASGSEATAAPTPAVTQAPPTPQPAGAPSATLVPLSPPSAAADWPPMLTDAEREAATAIALSDPRVQELIAGAGLRVESVSPWYISEKAGAAVELLFLTPVDVTGTIVVTCYNPQYAPLRPGGNACRGPRATGLWVFVDLRHGDIAHLGPTRAAGLDAIEARVIDDIAAKWECERHAS